MIWGVLFALLVVSTAEGCQSLQTIINNAPAGAVVKIPCGTYREEVTVNKALTLDGQGCVKIQGSEIWTGWVNAGGGLWTHSGSPDLPDVFGDCRGDDDARCNWPEQVFLNGVPLVQVAPGATPTTGQFKTSGEGGTITIADDPTGKTVEVTVRWVAIRLTASNVTIQNMTIQHLATPVYLAGIFRESVAASNAIIRNNTIQHIHTTGIGVSDTDSWLVIGNTLTLNGHHGLAGGGAGITNLTVKDNIISYNNTEDFDPGNSAGGVKLALLNGGLFENNIVHDNAGPGLWCDVACQNVSYIGNTIYDNEQQGIFYEISDVCTIRDNKLWNNGWGFNAWCYGANIVISSSSECEVYNNTVAWGPKGITALSQDRPPYNTTPVGMTDINIHDNVMVSDTLVGDMFFTGWCQDFSPTADPIYAPSSGNVGADNQFWITGEGDPAAFGWNNSLMSLSACNATNCGSGSNSYMTAAEKDAILNAAGIPTTPPPHP